MLVYSRVLVDWLIAVFNTALLIHTYCILLDLFRRVEAPVYTYSIQVRNIDCAICSYKNIGPTFIFLHNVVRITPPPAVNCYRYDDQMLKFFFVTQKTARFVLGNELFVVATFSWFFFKEVKVYEIHKAKYFFLFFLPSVWYCLENFVMHFRGQELAQGSVTACSVWRWSLHKPSLGRRDIESGAEQCCGVS